MPEAVKITSICTRPGCVEIQVGQLSMPARKEKLCEGHLSKACSALGITREQAMGTP
jgi:hypothetical protein